MNGSFSRRELRDIGASTAVLSVAFGLGFMDYLGVFGGFLVALFVVGIGFILHELGHRTVARRFGAVAEYRAHQFGLILALLTSIATNGSVVFAAPGAVYISPHKYGRWHKETLEISVDEAGAISAVGPMINITLATVFLGLNYVFPSPLLVLAANVNSFLALFNLLPIQPLDGAKVMGWDWKVWLLMIAVAAVGWKL